MPFLCPRCHHASASPDSLACCPSCGYAGPGRPSPADVWARAAAYLIDYAVVAGLWLLAHQVLKLWWPGLPLGPQPRPDVCSNTATFEPGPTYLSALPDLLYFTALEGVWGRALGKWLLRLRVVRAGRDRPPGVPRALLRTTTFCVLMYLPRHLLALGTTDCLTGMLLSVLAWGNLGGVLLVVSTMRWRNGYRGPHDFLSGTAVLRGTGAVRGRRWKGPDRVTEGLAWPADAPDQVGSFAVTGAVSWRDGGGVLVGEDMAPGRRALLWLRPAAEPALSPERRALNRPARLRWLADGHEGGVRWDAFAAEGGCPLPELVARSGRLGWDAAGPLLRQLAEELATACEEGTVPRVLSPHQVWVQRSGRVILVDMPVDPGDERSGTGTDAGGERSRALLCTAARLALEGEPTPAGWVSTGAQAPLPVPAAEALAALFGGADGSAAVRAFRDALGEAREGAPVSRLGH
jgi:uncharacterized RDD family membrane protein YckC